MTISARPLLPALCLALLALACTPLWAQGYAVVAKRATDLRDMPADSGRRVESLVAGAPLTHLGPRQGAWVQVRTDRGRAGWLHMFDIGATGGASQGGSAAGGLRDLGNLFNRQPPGSTVTATSTVGIRGLGEEDIARAQPNVRAVALMERQRLDAGSAQQFARGAALVARPVADLPAPGSPAGTPAEGGE